MQRRRRQNTTLLMTAFILVRIIAPLATRVSPQPHAHLVLSVIIHRMDSVAKFVPAANMRHRRGRALARRAVSGLSALQPVRRQRLLVQYALPERIALRQLRRRAQFAPRGSSLSMQRPLRHCMTHRLTALDLVPSRALQAPRVSLRTHAHLVLSVTIQRAVLAARCVQRDLLLRRQG
jgi:hypothetical protein